MTARVHISVVTPVYGRSLDLVTLYERIRTSLSSITEDFEIVMVNDASPDNAWEVIQKLSGRDRRVKGVNLSKNFGQHEAITAGIELSRGEWVVVMDCDLQDPPEDIPKLYNKALNGFDIVFGKRKERNDSATKKTLSRLFFLFIKHGCGLEHEPETANFGIFSRRVVKETQNNARMQMPFMRRLHDLGFRRSHVQVGHNHREIGESSYSLRKRISLAFDSVISYSNRPLKFAVACGFSMSAISAIYAAVVIAQYLFLQKPPAGWASVIVSLYFIGGLLLAIVGVLGLYVGKVFDVARGRPAYVVQETTFEKGRSEDDGKTF
ncbi:glycosyltransferase family 2 protein [Marinihelvus fidelis]|uniref:Glycosyltransferase family 2 protein n=1 Tax=Marinihelvus fidelis TaxID=2613842 RepID=A0A5N0T3U8_9GAMM|nr:glycosyltransferase family 2 protein [Marinihelvus fidelis]KAA9129740.1 glycosyltransferase family 2 protein [Marinihelvus fidelis]